ncbi:hypothetical protein ACIHFD_51475 [Nonomuraea sp. NPDC051941]|uniref:hypothetical protein n=1 Tax=Nonomuraea sp. NPDC051941 TaxID=3364373 RepID=UPI0037C56C97
MTIIALAVDHAVSCQRRRQDDNGPASERSAKVDAMNGSAIAASEATNRATPTLVRRSWKPISATPGRVSQDRTL